MSKFSLLNGVTVVILVTFGEMRLDFSVCNISKKYTWYIDTWTDSYKISQSGFFSSPVYHLTVQGLPDWLANMMAFWVGHDASEKKSRFHFTVAG